MNHYFKEHTVKRRHQDEKFTTYYRLIEFLEKPGCAFCNVYQDAASNYLETLLYENVNDPGIRTRLKESIGFCPDHARNVLQMNDPLGVAIIYDDILAIIENAIERNDIVSIKGKKECPVCVSATKQEEIYMNELQKHITDHTFQEKIMQSDGFCLPHFRRVMKRVDKNTAEFLTNIHRDKMKNLRADIAEFKRRNDYRFSSEPMTEKERTSWIRAVQFVIGKKLM